MRRTKENEQSMRSSHLEEKEGERMGDPEHRRRETGKLDRKKYAE